MRIIGGERKWDRGTRVRERGRRRGGRGNKGTNAKSILPKKTPKHTTGAHTHTQPHTSQLSNPRCCQCVCAYTCYTELSHCSRCCVPTWKSANTARTHRTTYLISKRIWGSLNGLGIATFMFVSVGFSISRFIFYIRLGRSWSPQRPATCKLLVAPMFSLPRGERRLWLVCISLKTRHNDLELRKAQDAARMPPCKTVSGGGGTAFLDHLYVKSWVFL